MTMGFKAILVELQELNCSGRARGYFILNGDKAPPAARDSTDFERRRYSHTWNGGHHWCLSSNLSLSVVFSIQDEGMDVAQSASQGDHYHVDVTYLGTRDLWLFELSLHQLGSRPTFFILRWTTHPCVPRMFKDVVVKL